MSSERSRFEGVVRLYDEEAFARLQKAHVCIVGVGGVGSWAAEALARSGVGRLTLIDLDEACVSNINRQVHALTDTVGRSKVLLMQERIAQINPDCVVTPIEEFFMTDNSEELMAPGYDFVLDAIDRVGPKSALIAFCRRRKIKFISAGGAGGLDTPYQLQVTDINRCRDDALLSFVRKRLRRKYNFPKQTKGTWGVPVVYSPHNRSSYEKSSSCEVTAGGSLDCAGSLGSACFVTGSMGFFAAAYIVNKLVQR